MTGGRVSAQSYNDYVYKHNTVNTQQTQIRTQYVFVQRPVHTYLDRYSLFWTGKIK